MNKINSKLISIAFYLIWFMSLINLFILDEISFRNKITIVAGAIAMFSKYRLVKSK
jgi:hypothetical protein